MQRLSFHDEIRKNKISSFFLVGAVLLVLLVLVYTIAAIMGGDLFFIILIFGIIFSLVYVVGGYYKSADLAIASVGAKKSTGTEYRQYHNIL